MLFQQLSRYQCCHALMGFLLQGSCILIPLARSNADPVAVCHVLQGHLFLLFRHHILFSYWPGQMRLPKLYDLLNLLFPLVRDHLPISYWPGLMLFQQLSGINAVMFYSVSIFIDSDAALPHLSAVILGLY